MCLPGKTVLKVNAKGITCCLCVLSSTCAVVKEFTSFISVNKHTHEVQMYEKELTFRIERQKRQKIMCVCIVLVPSS